MTTGENIMRLGASELIVSRLGIGAMTWGDISISPRFNPARFAYDLLEKRGVPLASNQVEYSLFHREPEKNGILNACHELNITLIAYMPLRMGALTGKYLGNIVPKGFRKFMSPFRRKDLPRLAQVVTLLQEIGSRYGKSASQVALRWLLQKGIVLPIPGAKNSEQASENAGALSFVITSAEEDALNKASMKW